MPRPTTIAADIMSFLERRADGADIEEITDALRQVRRAPVLRHSVRSAIYQHLDGQGDCLFVRLGRGRYGLRR
jgi:hypothetical protein